MIAAFLSKFLAWLGSRGLRILVGKIAKELLEAEIDRDYKIAMTELALAEKSAEAEKAAKEVRNEVEALPDNVLRERAGGWVRGTNRPKGTEDK